MNFDTTEIDTPQIPELRKPIFLGNPSEVMLKLYTESKSWRRLAKKLQMDVGSIYRIAHKKVFPSFTSYQKMATLYNAYLETESSYIK